MRINRFKREYVSLKNAFNITSWQTDKQFGSLFSDRGFTAPEDVYGYVQTLFSKYVIPKCYKKPITYFDYNCFDEEDKQMLENEAVTDWLGELYVWIEETEYKYNEIIRNQEQEISHLMDSIKNTTINKFNDTPQTSTETETDEFNTNVTTTVQSNEAGTRLQRLKELKQDLRNVYGEWLREFQSQMLLYNNVIED